MFKSRHQQRFGKKAVAKLFSLLENQFTNLIISWSSCNQSQYFIVSRHNLSFSYYLVLYLVLINLLGFNKDVTYREFFSYKTSCKSRCRGFLRHISQSKTPITKGCLGALDILIYLAILKLKILAKEILWSTHLEISQKIWRSTQMIISTNLSLKNIYRKAFQLKTQFLLVFIHPERWMNL